MAKITINELFDNFLALGYKQNKPNKSNKKKMPTHHEKKVVTAAIQQN